MKTIKLALPLFILLAYTPAHSQTATTATMFDLNADSLTVFANTYASQGANSIVYGNVLSGDVATVGAAGTVYGNEVSVGANTAGGAASKVTGNIWSGGVLTTGQSSITGGSLKSSGAGTIGDSANVSGNMTSGGVTTVGANAVLKGNLLSGGTATVSASGTVLGTIGATGLITAPSYTGTKTTLASSPIVPSDFKASIQNTVTSTAAQVTTAQTAFEKMGGGTLLTPTLVTSGSLTPGVYSAASLSTTAGTTLTLDGGGKANQFWVFNIADILAFGGTTNIVLSNPGVGDSVIWNVSNGYASLGDGAHVIGTILARTYISVGANAVVTRADTASCGGVFSATSYVEAGDTAKIGGSGCSGTGINAHFGIDGGTAVHLSAVTSPVPEPGTSGMLLGGLALIGCMVRARKLS
ncbi:ice-binding family protein [Glaciimonas immobilis]|uniref:Ice-binding protein C-terminal domain-containing protein n=1 Tax=Glaciimonas immobilis TaxID=728004 RepID=A0A840RQW9_9BURK|nr:ice-binding family protein [Glaciimonas immobilis]KAF3998250.1 DUF3494 domain-containing protein [Glaciimonas immobilis]MBB5199114.1 hypothetical protein [Glaciimonas immobilis]